MSDPAALERSYRRLLAWYPRGFRREYEQEVLAVLLAEARPGQRRPVLAEAVNLIISGLGLRLRRRRVIVGALTCVVAIGALGYTLVAPKGYLATAAVTFAPTGADQAHQTPAGQAVEEGPTVNLDTEAHLVTSETVTMRAARLLHSPLAPAQLSGGVTVAVPPNSAILDITCHAPTATGAATCANAFARAYVQNRNAHAQGIGAVIITLAPPA